jgi:RNA polymerase sigma factor (sigma-70 family)
MSSYASNSEPGLTRRKTLNSISAKKGASNKKLVKDSAVEKNNVELEIEGNFDIEEYEDAELEVLLYHSESNLKMSGTALSAFQRAADRYPPLTPAQQLEYAAVYREGQNALIMIQKGTLKKKELDKACQKVSESEKAMEYLCASCWRLAWLLVREQADMRFGKDKSAEHLPDLMAEANTALVEAVKFFDPSKTPQFHTYAARRIRDHLRSVLAKEGYMRLAPSWNRVKRMAVTLIPELTTQLGRHPAKAELQEALMDRCLIWAEDHLTEEQKILPETQKQQLRLAKLRKQGMLGAIKRIDEVMTASQAVASLDAPVGDADSGGTLKDLVSNTGSGDSLFDSLEMQELKEAIAQALTLLSPRERDIIELRFGFAGEHESNWTYAKIAERHDVTAERVRQIEKTALSKLSSPHGQFSALAAFLPNSDI